MLKRIFALMMVAVMINCAYVYAEEVENSLSEKEIETVTSYNIFVGNENGDLMLQENVTRAQMCKILFAARGMSPEKFSQENIFSDVAAEHWAYSYISAAQKEKLIEGFPEGMFKPDDNVKIQDAVKMIVCTLGYEELALSKGGYPTGYITTAMQHGITKDVPFKLDENATRGQIVKLICNSLDVPVMQKVEYDDKIEYVIMDGKDGRERITFRSMLDENAYSNEGLRFIALDKDDVEKNYTFADAKTSIRGNQEIYTFSYEEGDVSSLYMTFYNNVLVECRYDFKEIETAYAFAKTLRDDMERVFGQKTTYPGMIMSYGDYFDNIKDTSLIKNGFKYFEDWTLAGAQIQMKHHEGWKPYLTDEKIIKKITGDREYGRIDLSLVLDVVSESMVSVCVKCSVLP